jgi:hypothetical protein
VIVIRPEKSALAVPVACLSGVLQVPPSHAAVAVSVTVPGCDAYKRA